MKNRIRMWGNIGFGVLCALVCAGCIYATSFDAGMEPYALLYGFNEWTNDTGWNKVRLIQTEIPLWNTLEGAQRAEVGTIKIGSVAKVLSTSKYGYQIVNPTDDTIGWINKIYVKEIIPADLAKKKTAKTEPEQVQAAAPQTPDAELLHVYEPGPKAPPLTVTLEKKEPETTPKPPARDVVVSSVSQEDTRPPARSVTVTKVG